MTIRIYPVIIGLALVSVFSSCGVPPDEASSFALIESLDGFFKSEESPVSILDLFFSFRKLHGVDHLVTVLEAGDRLILTGEESLPADETLLYTVGGNHMRVHRTVFITCDRKRHLYYSGDGRIWFPMKSYRKKGEINVEYTFPAETVFKKAERILFMNFQWSAAKSSTAIPVKMKKKPLLSLERAMVFYSTDDENDTLDLSEYFLEIPYGTDITFQIQFQGNLVKSSSDGIVNEIVIQRDFQIYTTNDSDYKLGISLDGQKWNYNIFSFEYNVTESFSGLSSRSLLYNRVIEISYDE